jgi:hypothetical protein
MKTKSAHKVLHELAWQIISDNCLHGRPSDDPFTPSKPNKYGRKHPKVGGLIENLSEQDRDALKTLTSKDASNIRML